MKLTLALNDKIIDQAKKYAKHRKTSLSKLVEYYFQSITQAEENEKVVLSPITTEMLGMIKAEIKNDKEVLTAALMEKYL